MLSGIASISVVTNAAIVGFVGTVLVQATLDPASILSMMQEEPFSTIDPEGNQTCMGIPPSPSCSLQAPGSAGLYYLSSLTTTWCSRVDDTR